MTATPARSTLTQEELTDLRRRMCGTKRTYSAHHAQEVAARMREQGQPVSAYPCPFHQNEPGNGTWHVGHAPNVRRMELLARYLRFGGPSC